MSHFDHLRSILERIEPIHEIQTLDGLYRAVWRGYEAMSKSSQEAAVQALLENISATALAVFVHRLEE